MLYTNGIIVIHKNNDLEELKSAIVKVANHLQEMKGETHTFEFTDENEFPAYKLPEGVTYNDLDEVLRPYVAFKAINEDQVYLMGTTTVEKRYDFDQDELQDIANDITSHFKKKKEIEARKKIAVKQFDSEIGEEDKNLNEKIDLHRNGYEFRNFKAKTKYNFKDGQKYYVDVNDEETVLKTERMTSEEKKMRIDHKYEKPTQTTLFEADSPGTVTANGEDKKDEEVTKETDDLVI